MSIMDRPEDHSEDADLDAFDAALETATADYDTARVAEDAAQVQDRTTLADARQVHDDLMGGDS